jgi:excisionase family DNA binding protein
LFVSEVFQQIGAGSPGLDVCIEYYVDAIEAAKFLNESVGTILRWAEAGQIPAHRLRHETRSCWKFKLSELKDWSHYLECEEEQLKHRLQ